MKDQVRKNKEEGVVSKKDIAIVMMKPHSLKNTDLFVNLEDIIKALFIEYNLEIIEEYVKTLSGVEAKNLDKKFHDSREVISEIKQDVIDCLKEGSIKTFWISGENAYEKCREIRKLLRKSLDADNTSVYNFVHVVDWEDLKSSSEILFDLQREGRIKKRRYSSEIVLGYEFLEGREVSLLGRISSIRDLGKIIFFRVNDVKGNIQIVLQEGKGDGARYSPVEFKKIYKEGDIVSVRGNVMKSKTGETSVFASEISTIILSSIRINIDYKEINSDVPGVILLQNPDIKENLKKRSQILQLCREILTNDGNLEVETPVLNDIFNGGYSEPFIVRNANYDKEQYLRVSSELYLKQLIIAGLEGVFEIGKQFRGGGSENISKSEYTSLEFYRAYQDHIWMMEYIQEMFVRIGDEVLQGNKVNWFGDKIDLSKEWEVITFDDAFKKFAEIDICSINNTDMKKLLKQQKIVEKDMDSMLLSLFKVLVAPKLNQPTFIYNYPAGVSPYSKRDFIQNGRVLKFGGYISGKKIVDGSVEENDNDHIKANLIKQMKEKKLLGVKTYPEDDDFLSTLKYGMPPLVGVSISIDRLVMFFTESRNIREVNIF